MPRFLLRTGARIAELNPGVAYLGRSAECLVRLDETLVSRRHARLEVDPDGVFLEDLGSLNGTLVNRRATQGRQRLVPGDVIQIGSVEMRFELAARRDTVRGVAPVGPPLPGHAAFGPPSGGSIATDPGDVTSPGVHRGTGATPAPQMPVGPTPRPAGPTDRSTPPPSLQADLYEDDQEFTDPVAAPPPQLAARRPEADLGPSTPPSSRLAPLLLEVARKALALSRLDEARRVTVALHQALFRASDVNGFTHSTAEAALTITLEAAQASRDGLLVDGLLELAATRRWWLDRSAVERVAGLIQTTQGADGPGLRLYLQVFREARGADEQELLSRLAQARR